MRKRLTIALAVSAVVAVMAPSAASAGGKMPQQRCLRAAAKALHVKQADLPAFDDIYVGTDHDDTTYTLASGSGPSPHGGSFDDDDDDLICGFNGDDAVATIGQLDVFIGGNGDDSADSLSGTSVFYGGNGRDSVLEIFQGATFRGGNGADWLTIYDDAIDAFWAQYDGGRGPDLLMEYTIVGSCLSVEVVVSGGPCPAPQA